MVKYDEAAGGHAGRTSSVAFLSVNVGLLLLPLRPECGPFISMPGTIHSRGFDAFDNIECKPHLRVLLVLLLLD